MLLFIALPLNLFAEQRFYGIYSNMVSSGGELSGFEMFFLHDGRPGKCSDSVLFQFSEGWPQYPELLDCCGCSANHIEFFSKDIIGFDIMEVCPHFDHGETAVLAARFIKTVIEETWFNNQKN